MAVARIGNLLVKNRTITLNQLEEGLKRQREKGGNLGSNLIDLGYVNEDQLTSALATQLGVRKAELKAEELDEDVANLIPAEVAIKFNAIVFEKVGKTLKVAIADPTNSFALDSIKLVTGCKIEPYISTESTIKSLIERLYKTTEEVSTILNDFDKSGDLEVLEELIRQSVDYMSNKEW